MALLLATACYAPGEGIQAPFERLYFPVGVAKSPRSTRLYVVSSDFDLQFNGGALQVYDLERIRAFVPRECSQNTDCGSEESCDLEPSEANGAVASRWCLPSSGPQAGKPCGPFGEKQPGERWIQPGRCGYVNPTAPQDGTPSLVLASVGVGAFATDVLYRSRPPASDGNERPGGRLFVPVRGDATLHWIEVDDDSKSTPAGVELECGQALNDGKCDAAHRAGDDPAQENTRDLRLPPEPYAVDATADGRAILLTHQTAGQVSLLVNDWDREESAGPHLEFVQGGLPARVVGIAAVPEPAVLAERNRLATTGEASPVSYAPAFWVTFANQTILKRMSYYSDSGVADPTSPDRPFISDTATIGLVVNSGSYDSRGIAFDPSTMRSCEANCRSVDVQARLSCLSQCSEVPLGVYVANRTPESVITGVTQRNGTETSSDDSLHFNDSIPLPVGPSRVVVGSIIDLDGQPRARVFVVCFEQRRIAIYDPTARRVEKWIETGRGPHALATDLDPESNPTAGILPRYAYAYVAHFTDSYLAVVDLDRRHALGYGQMVLTLGQSTPPRASK